MSQAPTPQLIAVDLVVVNLLDDSKVLFIRRLNDPFKDQLAFPGGFVEPDETVEQAAVRELAEETGISASAYRPRLIGIWADPRRDPRGRVISAAYRLDVGTADLQKAKAGDDAKALVWLTQEEATKSALAFDHNDILLAAIRGYK